MIRIVELKDAKSICEIYNYYVENTSVSFEEISITIDEMKDRINKITLDFPWIVYEENEKLIGYAYVTKWKARSAYRFTLESTVYVDMNYKGKGVGTILYKELLNEIEKREFKNIMAVITLPNPASIALHEKLGFVKAAHFKKVGYKFDKWLDVGYWQYSFKE